MQEDDCLALMQVSLVSLAGPRLGRLLLGHLLPAGQGHAPPGGKGKAAVQQHLLCAAPIALPQISLLGRKEVLKYLGIMSLTGLGAAQPTWKSKIPARKSLLQRAARKRQLSEKKGKGHKTLQQNCVHSEPHNPTAPAFLPGPAPYICLHTLQANLQHVPLYFPVKTTTITCSRAGK